MKLAFQMIACWLVFSCVMGPLLTWAFFRRDRLERDSGTNDNYPQGTLPVRGGAAHHAAELAS
jgi:hypothetical protein